MTDDVMTIDPDDPYEWREPEAPSVLIRGDGGVLVDNDAHAFFEAMLDRHWRELMSGRFTPWPEASLGLRRSTAAMHGYAP